MSTRAAVSHSRHGPSFTVPGDRSTLPEILEWRARQQTFHVAFRVLENGEAERAPVTYGELHRRANGIAAWLRGAANPGTRVLIIGSPGVDLIAAFLGCLAARMVAVLVPPPNMARWERFLERTGPVVRDAGPALALAPASVREQAGEAFAADGLHARSWFGLEPPGEDAGGAHRAEPPRPEDLAFLQYTSGSTGRPKGVRVTHANLMHNLALISQSFATASGDRTSVVWLPPYHDMGLIGGMLSPIYVGSPATVMPPEAFVQRPRRWLEAISANRARVSGGPTFAYDLCIRKITPEQRARLDLSCWEVAFCGAEPIDPSLVRDFAEWFAPCGFDAQAFKACYGLAEATLMVSAARSGIAPSIRAFRKRDLALGRASCCQSQDPESTSLVSCGPPASPVRIVDPETRAECPAGAIGEIWVAGASVGAGYWNRPAETRATFQASLAGASTEPYLRTGDLGFLLDGELFVSGRLKDLIIIDGQNHHPQDIEHTVGRCVPAQACVAFSVDHSGREALVIVVAVRVGSAGEVEGIQRTIQAALAAHHDLRAMDIVLVRPRQIPRTPSGKVQRQACRERYQAGTLLPGWVP